MLEGGGPAGVKDFNDGGGPAGVLDKFVPKVLPPLEYLWLLVRCSGVVGEFEERGNV